MGTVASSRFLRPPLVLALTLMAVGAGWTRPAAAASVKAINLPAPAVGSASVQMLTFKASGKKPPKVKVSDLAQLGDGFGTVGLVGPSKKAKGTFIAYFVSYMGNLSTAPAGTMDLQFASPVGSPKTTDETDDCAVLSALSIFAGGEKFGGTGGLTVLGAALSVYYQKTDDSTVKSFLSNTVSFLGQSAGCTP